MKRRGPVRVVAAHGHIDTVEKQQPIRMCMRTGSVW